jgi:tripartite-type tricarboxylate transporter receptor subunit TctC
MLPDYPTLSEAGVPGFEVIGYFGFLAPARTPAGIVSRLNGAMAAVVHRPDIVERLAADGTEPDGGPPATLRDLLRRDIEKTADIIRAAGIKPQ